MYEDPVHPANYILNTSHTVCRTRRDLTNTAADDGGCSGAIAYYKFLHAEILTCLGD